MVSLDQIEQGVAAYIDTEIMPHLPSTGLEKILVGTAIGMGIRKYRKEAETWKNNKAIKMLGIIDERGNVDVDALVDEIKKQLPKDGLKIDIPAVGGMTFHTEDIDKLHDYITM